MPPAEQSDAVSDAAATGDCIFCRIVTGDVPADIVDRSDHTVAFRDLNPQAPVHVLVIPRRHIENAATVEHADAEVMADMVVMARRVAAERGHRRERLPARLQRGRGRHQHRCPISISTSSAVAP